MPTVFSLPYGMKPDYGHDGYGKSTKNGGVTGQNSRWLPTTTQKHRNNKKNDHSTVLRGKQSK